MCCKSDDWRTRLVGGSLRWTMERRLNIPAWPIEAWGVSPSAAFPTTHSNFPNSLSAVAKPLCCPDAAISHHDQMYNRAFNDRLLKVILEKFRGVNVHVCRETDTATQHHSKRKVLILGFLPLSFKRGSFIFGSNFISAAWRCRGNHLLFGMRRLHVQMREAAARWESLKWTQAWDVAWDRLVSTCAAVFHVACSGPPKNSDQNHKWIRRSARWHKTHQSGSCSGFLPF